MLVAVDADRLASTTIDPWSLTVALVTVVASWILSRIARRSVLRLTEHLDGFSPEIRALAGRIAGYFVLFVGLGVALTFLGAEIQPLIAAVILVAVIMALALRGLAENFAAGVLIQTRRPIAIGDEIEASDFEGIVTEMNGRSVIVETFDGRTVHLPNADLLAGPLVNHSTHGSRRAEVEIRVESEPSPDMVQRFVSVTSNVTGVLPEPAPACFVRAIEPHRVTLFIRFWHAPTGGASVISAVLEALAHDAATRGQVVAVISPPPASPLTPSPAI